MLTCDHFIVMYVSCRGWWTLYFHHWHTYWKSYACSNLHSPRSHSHATTVPRHCPRTSPHSKCDISSSQRRLRCSLALYKFHAISYLYLMALQLQFLVFVGGSCSQCMGSSRTLWSLGPYQEHRHKYGLALRHLPCAHGVLNSFHGEVYNIITVAWKGPTQSVISPSSDLWLSCS